MLSVRFVFGRTGRTHSTGVRKSFLSTVAAAKPPSPEDSAVGDVVTEKRQEMSKFDRHMVWGVTGERYLPAPVLPENPTEIALLDPVDQGHRTMADGRKRTVIIRQQKKSTRQAPLNPESSWKIYFYEDGILSERWSNSLMGWTSNADPYQVAPPLSFANASEAVYFSKKRGWNYVVKQPILRYLRRDDAQYQDNFLPIATASRVKREGVTCDEWHRTNAGTSHYFRPLKYHGDGTVRQHGPSYDAKIAPHVPGQYKIR